MKPRKLVPTPRPWKLGRIDDPSYVDGFAYAITDSRGHIIFECCQKGDSNKAYDNVYAVLDAINQQRYDVNGFPSMNGEYDIGGFPLPV